MSPGRNNSVASTRTRTNLAPGTPGLLRPKASATVAIILTVVPTSTRPTLTPSAWATMPPRAMAWYASNEGFFGHRISPPASTSLAEEKLTATTYTIGKSIATAIKTRKIALIVWAGRLGRSIHAGRPVATASRLTTAVATSVNPFVAEAFGTSVGSHDQDGAYHATHQAHSGRKAPVTALDTAEIDERVQNLGGLGAE